MSIQNSRFEIQDDPVSRWLDDSWGGLAQNLRYCGALRLLVPTKGPVDSLVIDHVESPSEN